MHSMVTAMKWGRSANIPCVFLSAYVVSVTALLRWILFLLLVLQKIRCRIRMVTIIKIYCRANLHGLYLSAYDVLLQLCSKMMLLLLMGLWTWHASFLYLLQSLVYYIKVLVSVVFSLLLLLPFVLNALFCVSATCSFFVNVFIGPSKEKE